MNWDAIAVISQLTYFHHHDLGLMPDTHWRGYERFMAGYAQSPGFREVWKDIGPSFSEDFARWVDGLLLSPQRESGHADE